MNHTCPVDQALQLALRAYGERQATSFAQTAATALTLALNGHDETTVSAYILTDALQHAPELRPTLDHVFDDAVLDAVQAAASPSSHQPTAQRMASVLAAARTGTPTSVLILCARAIAHLRHRSPSPKTQHSPAHPTCAFYTELADVAHTRGHLQEAEQLRTQIRRLYPIASAPPTPDPTPCLPQHVTEVTAYCDGSCLGNPGPGGWGVVLRYGSQDNDIVELQGHEPAATNNRMELLAVIHALEATPPNVDLRLVTDSQYVYKGVTQWLPNWKRKHWRARNGSPVKNQELWKCVDALCTDRATAFEWIRGHNGHPGNERADQLARHAAAQAPLH